MAKTSLPPGWPPTRWGPPEVSVAIAAAARVCGICGGCFTLVVWFMHLVNNTQVHLWIDWSDPLKDVNAEAWRESLFTFNPRCFGSRWAGLCMGVVSIGSQTQCLRIRFLTRTWLRFAFWHFVQALFANIGFCGGLGFAAASVSLLAVLLALIVHIIHPRLPVSWDIRCMPLPPHQPPISAPCFYASPLTSDKKRKGGGKNNREGHSDLTNAVAARDGNQQQRDKNSGRHLTRKRDEKRRQQQSRARHPPVLLQEQEPDEQKQHYETPTPEATRQQQQQGEILETGQLAASIGRDGKDACDQRSAEAYFNEATAADALADVHTEKDGMAHKTGQENTDSSCSGLYVSEGDIAVCSETEAPAVITSASSDIPADAAAAGSQVTAAVADGDDADNHSVAAAAVVEGLKCARTVVCGNIIEEAAAGGKIVSTNLAADDQNSEDPAAACNENSEYLAGGVDAKSEDSVAPIVFNVTGVTSVAAADALTVNTAPPTTTTPTESVQVSV